MTSFSPALHNKAGLRRELCQTTGIQSITSTSPDFKFSAKGAHLHSEPDQVDELPMQMRNYEQLQTGTTSDAKFKEVDSNLYKAIDQQTQASEPRTNATATETPIIDLNLVQQNHRGSIRCSVENNLNPIVEEPRRNTWNRYRNHRNATGNSYRNHEETLGTAIGTIDTQQETAIGTRKKH